MKPFHLSARTGLFHVLVGASLVSVYQGCGVEDRTVSEAPQAGAGGQGQGGASGEGQGGAIDQGGANDPGGADGNAGAGDTTGGGGEGGAAGETCGADGAACDEVPGGLCKQGSCVQCTDTTDDAACAAAHGAGNICAGGTCKTGCHDSASCEGMICDAGSFTCVPCGQDLDCSNATPATPYCHVSAGTCNAAPEPCTPNGGSCNSDSGRCCAGTCYVDAGCCDNADCNGGNCNQTTHLCQPAGCTDAPPTDRFYVNSAAPANASGVGSHQCPFTSLNSALAAIPAGLNSEFTICTTGTFAGTNPGSWPRYVPTHVTLDGTYCEDNLPHTKLNVQKEHSGVYFVEAGPAGMHGYDIVYQGDRTTETFSSVGIHVTNEAQMGTVTISDVTINGFTYGINVTDNGNLLIENSVHAHTNVRGLNLHNLAKVEIRVPDGPDQAWRTTFEENNTGIWVNGATLTVNGAPYTGVDNTINSKTVTTNLNAYQGLWITGAANVTIDSLNSINNHYGLIVFTGEPTLKVSHAQFTSNTRGIEIRIGETGTSLSQLNFGTTATGTGAGNNVIYGNAEAGICLVAEATSRLKAMGNNFGQNPGGGKDCNSSTPATTALTHDPDCNMKVDATYHQKIDVQNCLFE